MLILSENTEEFKVLCCLTVLFFVFCPPGAVTRQPVAAGCLVTANHSRAGYPPIKQRAASLHFVCGTD